MIAAALFTLKLIAAVIASAGTGFGLLWLCPRAVWVYRACCIQRDAERCAARTWPRIQAQLAQEAKDRARYGTCPVCSGSGTLRTVEGPHVAH